MREGWSETPAGAGHRAVSLHRDCVLVIPKSQAISNHIYYLVLVLEKMINQRDGVGHIVSICIVWLTRGEMIVCFLFFLNGGRIDIWGPDGP